MLSATFESVLEETVRRAVRAEIRQALAELPRASSEDRRVTKTEAAAAAGVSAATISAWANAGRLRKYGQGRGLRFSLAEVRALEPEERAKGNVESRVAEIMGRRNG